MIRSNGILALSLLAAVVAFGDDANDLRVLTDIAGDVPPAKRFYAHLVNKAHQALDRRLERYETLTTPEQWQAEQIRLREFFLQQIGGIDGVGTKPPAEVVGTLVGDGFRVEKIIYESRPHHHVTAALYLPDSPPPYPAVLIACGHSKTGKGAEYNQRIGISLAQAGLAAMCYDPIGQGERSQILDDEGRAKYSASTTEHFLVGVGSILVGRNTAHYRLVDGLRGIDYLTHRPDIDKSRIGCTGCSGGGTMTSYIMAVDDRVACAAPACYLTTFGHLLDSLGPQDAEQNIFGQIAFGLDHPDYVLMRAPRPTLICSTTRDYFPIAGSWETFRQAKRVYTRFGFPERVNLVEVDSTHGVPKPSREAIVRWMRRWLLDKDDSAVEADFKVFSLEQLQCTPDGEVLRLKDERSVFDLNREMAEELAERRREDWKRQSADEQRESVRRVTGIRTAEQIKRPEAASQGSIDRANCRVEKFLLTVDDGMTLPALLFIPKQKSNPALRPVVIADGGGKHRVGAADGEAERLASEGRFVLAVDVRGCGETAPAGDNKLLGADWKEYFAAYLLGKSFVQLRAEDLIASAKHLLDRAGDGATSVELVAIDQAAVAGLHAAALEPDLFAAARFKGLADSWMSVMNTNEPQGGYGDIVHGVLAVYDLPDLHPLVAK